MVYIQRDRATLLWEHVPTTANLNWLSDKRSFIAFQSFSAFQRTLIQGENAYYHKSLKSFVSSFMMEGQNRIQHSGHDINVSCLGRKAKTMLRGVAIGYNQKVIKELNPF